DGAYAFGVAHHKPLFLAEWGVRHASSTLTPLEDQAWLNEMFDYVEAHPAVKAIAYFDYKAIEDTTLAGHVFLDGGKVNYAPNVHDFDHRLIAESGANFRGTFSARIASSRYDSAIRTSKVRARR